MIDISSQNLQTILALIMATLLLLLSALAWYRAWEEDEKYDAWSRYKRNQIDQDQEPF